jgi:hypothetical protein
VPPQLGSVLAAMQSTEVAEKDQHHGSLAPQVAEVVSAAVSALERERGQSDDVHRPHP